MPAVVSDPRTAAGLVEHYAAALAAARRKYPGLSSPDHEDIVQEAIARVLQRLRRGPLAEPLPYLLRVVYTSGAHVLRDRHRLAVSLDDHAADLHGVEVRADRSGAPSSPDERVLELEHCARVRRVLVEQLTPGERTALVCRAVNGAPPVEVAAVLGTSVRRYRRVLESGHRKLTAALAA